MSIRSRVRQAFSSVKSKVKSAASKFVSVAKNSFAAVASPIKNSAGRSTLPKAQPNYTGLNFVEKKTLTPGNRPKDILSEGLKSGGLKVISPGSGGGLLNTRTIRSGGTSLKSSSTQGGGLTFNSYGGEAPTPKTLSGGQRSSSSLGSYSSSGLSFQTGPSSLSGGDAPSDLSISSSSLSSSPSVSLPSAPSYANVSSVTNAGLAGAASEGQTYDPASGLFLPAQADANAVSEEERRKKDFEDLMDMIPEKDSVYDDKEVKRQQKEVRQRQQELNNYTAQLNNIVAKRDADLLKVRGIGAEEGVTEAVYGGQAATIEREAAIRALPIQAQVAAAQGNLELAQDYLSELITVKRDQIDADYQYNKAKFDATRDYMTSEQKTRLDKIEKNEDRAYDRAQKNLDLQDEWARIAIQNGQNHLVSRIHSLNAGSPNFQRDLGNIVAGIQDIDAAKKLRDANGGGIDLTDEDRRILAGAGFNSAAINSIAADVSRYGVDAVIEGLSTQREKDAVMRVYGGGDDGATKLTRANLSTFFGIPDNNEQSGLLGFFGAGKTNREKLDELESAIARYQAVGYSDEEILKMMK